MKEFMKFFCCITRHEPREEAAQIPENKSVDPTVIKGFIFVSEARPCKPLDIDAFLSGKNNERMKYESDHTGSLLRSRYKYYETLDNLIRAKSQQNHHNRFERSCYILYMNVSAEETYAYMSEGKFHEAIAFARDFHEVWQEHASISHHVLANKSV